jgi:hypothetical protein
MTSCAKNMGLGCMGLAFMVASVPADAQTATPSISIEDALTCKLAVPDYNGFAMSLEDDDTGYKAMGWVKLVSPDGMLNLYRLPKPVTVDGHTTSTLAFSASGLAAVLDGVDAATLAHGLGMANTIPRREEAATGIGLRPKQMPESHIFKGEKLVVDKTEADPKLGKIHTRIVRHVETDMKLPGKVLDGCSYSMEFPDL